MLLLPTEIDFDHALVILDLIKSPVAENMSLVENCHFAPKLTNKDHVMLNHDDRVLSGETKKEFTCLGRFLVGHAGGRFIDQKELGILGQQHPDLEHCFGRADCPP
jgi:hypothetical protein